MEDNRAPQAIKPSQEQLDKAINIAFKDGELKDIAKALGMEMRTLSSYLKIHPTFAKELTDARIFRAHNLASTLLKITDDCTTMADAVLARVKSENIKWVCARLAPEIYGDRINIDIHQHVDISKALAMADAKIAPLLKQLEASKKDPSEPIDVTPKESSRVTIKK